MPCSNRCRQALRCCASYLINDAVKPTPNTPLARATWWQSQTPTGVPPENKLHIQEAKLLLLPPTWPGPVSP